MMTEKKMKRNEILLLVWVCDLFFVGSSITTIAPCQHTVFTQTWIK